MDNTGLWATPLVLLPGVALLILSTAVRYNRLHDEIHEMEHHGAEAMARSRASLLMRGELFRRALVDLYAAVSLLALASLVGVAGASLPAPYGPGAVIALTALSVLAILRASFVLVREARISLDALRAHFTD